MEEFCQKCIEQSIRFLLLRLFSFSITFSYMKQGIFGKKFSEAKANLGRNKTLDGNDLNTKEEKKKVVLIKICLPLPGAAQHFAAFLSDFLWVISFCRVTAPLGANTRSRLLIAAAAVVDLNIKCTANDPSPRP